MDIRYRLNGRDVSAEEFRAASAGIDFGAECLVGQSPAGWPKTSESLAVHPRQAAAAMEEARRLGVPTDYDRLGRPVLTSPGHLKELARKLGFVDRGKRNITMVKGRNHDRIER